MNKKILYLMMFVLCISLVSAAPRIPVQLYGDIEGVDNNLDIEISINDLYEVSSSTQSETLGVQNLVFLRKDDPSSVGVEGLRGNDVITIKIEGYEPITRNYDDSSVEIFYVDITADELVEEVDCLVDADCASNERCNGKNNCVSKGGTTGGSGGSSGGGDNDDDTTLSEGFCLSRWMCTVYSECINGVQTRTCFKEMPCNDSSIKPPERVACGTVVAGSGKDTSFESQPVSNTIRKDYDDTEITIIEEDADGVGLPYIIFFLILLLIILGLAYLYYEHLMARKSLTQPYKENKTLDKYVKETLKKGFRKKEVQEALIKKGWSKKEVNDYFYHHPELQDGGVKTLSNGQSNKITPVSSLIRKKVAQNKRKTELHEGAKELVGEGDRIKVKKYIDMTLKKGFSKEDIKGALTKHGWKEPVVDKYLYEDIKKKKAAKSKVNSDSAKPKSKIESPKVNSVNKKK